MKVSALVLHACALAVSLCCAGAGVADLGACALELPEGVPTVFARLSTSAEACARSHLAARELEARAANTTEHLRAAFGRACARERPMFTECLAEVGADAERCLVGIARTQFVLSLGLKQTVFDVECQRDGERSALIYEEQRKYYSSQYPVPLDIIQDCRLTAYGRVLLSYENHATPNHRMTYELRLLRDAIGCLEKHRGGEMDTLVDAGVAQWTDTLDRMKCVDPQDGKEVLCKTLVDILPESTVLPEAPVRSEPH